MSIIRRLDDALHAFRFGHTRRDQMRTKARRLRLLVERIVARDSKLEWWLGNPSEKLPGLLEDAIKRGDGAAWGVLANHLDIDRYVQLHRSRGDNVGDEPVDDVTDDASRRLQTSIASGKFYGQLYAGLLKRPLHVQFNRQFRLWCGHRHQLFLGLSLFARKALRPEADVK